MSEDIHFVCEHCDKHLSIDAQGAGMIVKCVDCGHPIIVPPPGACHDDSPPANDGAPRQAPSDPPQKPPLKLAAKKVQAEEPSQEQERRDEIEASRKCPSCGSANPKKVKKTVLARAGKKAAGMFLEAGLDAIGGGLLGDVLTAGTGDDAKAHDYLCDKCGKRWPVPRK